MTAAACLLYSVSSAALVGPSPYPRNAYDYNSARDFFASRPLEVGGRAAELVGLSAGFGASLLMDFAGGKMDENADKRASELVTLLTTLGPTFIKLGQSASIRTDLLPPAYIKGLTSLQDRVPPFSDAEARALIKEEARAALVSRTGLVHAAEIRSDTDGL